ncbi:hypothetical protein [Ruania zhangjianzhongii]|uniref:hypothetical protein n=1 Tax=Ruania zhangjianzhongii TaxID=2603206 RepID=UPI0011CC9568|nr:hypothetical protein [Ruania zhangjianzhongii]
MEAQVYHHKSDHRASDDTASALRPPTPLKWVFAGVVGGVVLLIGLPLAMWLGRDGFLTDSILAQDPGLTEKQLEFAVWASILYAAVLHAVDVVVTIWLMVKVWKGRQWARIAMTVYLVIATGGSLYSAAMGDSYLIAVIPTDALHLMMLVLLWVPRSVREFFSAHQRQRSTAQGR